MDSMTEQLTEGKLRSAYKMPGVTMAPSGGKANYYGIEVNRSLLWQGWEPGKEYVRKITLKNLSVKTVKLKYRLPESRFFSTLYPQPVILSAGTSFTLPVTFRPLDKVLHEDKIEFNTNEGKFAVSLRGLVPQMALTVPEDISFDMCAVNDQSQRSFTIKNRSELLTAFSIDALEPFSVEPSEGFLQPFETTSVTATFKPWSAVVYEGKFVINYGTETEKQEEVINVVGIGKYPHLVVSAGIKTTQLTDSLETTVDFGEVPAGNKGEKWIDLQNLSPVNAPFRIEHPSRSSRVDTVFHCIQKEGVVPARSSLRIPVVFMPTAVGECSVDYIHIKTISNISKTVVKFVGSSIGPLVHLSQTALNFHLVNAGLSISKTLDIVNSSKVEAYYQFMIDCDESVFCIDALCGVLPPQSMRTLTVSFNPIHAINYYRRISCVIHNEGVLFLDVMGTCHSETVKPVVMQKKHLENCHVHSRKGLSFYPPEQLHTMLTDGKLTMDDRGILSDPEAQDDSSKRHDSRVSPFDEYFNDGHHSETVNSSPHVSLDNHLADFGKCVDTRVISKMNVNLTNHTKGKITVVWMGGEDHPFSVSPATVDIPPMASAPFSVTFKPPAPNQFYGAELECYAFYKSQRDHRLVEDNIVCPPWCLTLTATGDTFQQNCEPFLPRVMLSSDYLLFPSTNAGESSYRTLLLANTGTTPVLYQLEPDPSQAFSMKPLQGLTKTPYQIFVIKNLPKERKTYQHTLQLKLNNEDKNTEAIEVIGSAETPKVSLENEGVLHFKPTCVGTTSVRQYSIQNTTRMPLYFEWKMSGKDSKLLNVAPSSGIILPNEIQYHTWEFTPTAQEKFVLKPTLIVCNQKKQTETDAKKISASLRVLGLGTAGELLCDQTYYDFGTVIVGNSQSAYVTLCNNSTCSLIYRLTIDQTVTGPYADEEYKNDLVVLDLDIREGILPARARQVIVATVLPHRRVQYQCSLSYQLLAPSGVQGVPKISEKQHLCHLLATGVYPTVTVSDIRGYGSAVNVSKKQLWSLFSIDHLNSCLDADPSPAELMYNASTRPTPRKRAPILTRAMVDFNFGAAPVSSDSSAYHIMLENSGTVSTKWQVMFPNELQLELEYWAESGAFTIEELHQMKIEENQIFTVSPSGGDLEPGQCQMVTLTYKHMMAGTDRLPVLLKLGSGREIMLNFVGVTVDSSRRYIHFSSDKHMFTPVPISDTNSPIQVYEMYNGGALPVKYEFNIVPLTILQNDNFDHAIFECLNPMGEVLPGRTAEIQWRFSPLEAKTYMVDVPIRIIGGDTTVVTFTGIGFDKRIMGDTMPLTDQSDATGAPSNGNLRTKGQPCYLSEERLSFGNVPLFSRARRVISVSNASNEHGVTYRWHVASSQHSTFVIVSPASGHLGPGEATICKVTFIAKGLPTFYDISLVCEVLNETEAGEYQMALQEWEGELYRQQVEFTITEEDTDADMRLPDVEDRPPSGRLKSLDATRTPSPEVQLARYQTLPPIKLTSTEAERLKWKKKRKLEKKLWERPTPPKPFLIRLGITARTHSIPEFQANFPEEYKTFYIDRTLGEPTAENADDQIGIPESVNCLQSEVGIISGALSNIIRGVLNDTMFHETLDMLADEPTPYFTQFAEKIPPTPATPAPSVFVQDYEDELEDIVEPKRSRSQGSQTPKSEVKVTSAGSQGRRSRPDTAGSGAEPEQKEIMAEEKPESVGDTEKPLTRQSSRVSGRETLYNEEKGQMENFELPQESFEQNVFAEQQQVKKHPQFGSLTESVLENTIMNIMHEAFRQEFNITARPRLVALLPRQASTISKK